MMCGRAPALQDMDAIGEGAAVGDVNTYKKQGSTWHHFWINGTIGIKSVKLGVSAWDKVGVNLDTMWCIFQCCLLAFTI